MKNKNRYPSVRVCAFINTKDGRSESGFVIKDHSDYGASKQFHVTNERATFYCSNDIDDLCLQFV